MLWELALLLSSGDKTIVMFVIIIINSGTTITTHTPLTSTV
jgi:hypothetical protein